MSSDEIRSEHVMIRLKPSERVLLEQKAKQENIKPTQLAYKALMNALDSKYTMQELGKLVERHSKRLETIEAELLRVGTTSRRPSKSSSK